MKIIIRAFLFICCATLVVTNLFAQSKVEAVKKELQQIAKKMSPLGFKMKIEFWDRSWSDDNFEKADECILIQQQDRQRSIFKDYETFVSNQLYIKVNHFSKEIYLIKNDDTNAKASNNEEYWSFDEMKLKRLNMELDSIETSIKDGKIVYKSNLSKDYEKLTFVYNILNYAPISYTVLFKRQDGSNIAAISTVFKEIEFTNVEFDALLDRSIYITNYNKPNWSVSDAYEDYKMIKNF